MISELADRDTREYRPRRKSKTRGSWPWSPCPHCRHSIRLHQNFRIWPEADLKVVLYNVRLAPVDQTLRLRCRLFQRIGLLMEAKPAWVDDCTWSPVDPGCVKTPQRSRRGQTRLIFRALRPSRSTKVVKNWAEHGHFQSSEACAWSFYTASTLSRLGAEWWGHCSERFHTMHRNVTHNSCHATFREFKGRVMEFLTADVPKTGTPYEIASPTTSASSILQNFGFSGRRGIVAVQKQGLLAMTKRYKALTEYESLDYEADLDAIEAHVTGNRQVIYEQLELCGVDPEDIDWERMASDLVMKLTKFVLYCNAHVSRNPKAIMVTVKEIGRDPTAFRKNPECYDPEAKTMVLGEAARLHYKNEILIQKWELEGGRIPKKAQIEEAVPLVLDILRIEAEEMASGRPEQSFQSELAYDLGTIFRNQGGKLRRDPKQLHKLPFRSFLELMIEILQPFARKAGFGLNATTMIEKAQEQPAPLR